MADETMRVVVTDYDFPSLEQERQVLEPMGAVLEVHQCRTEDEVVQAVRGARVVLTQYAPFGAKALAALAPEAVVIRYGIGVDTIDLDAARSLGVRVANIPDYGVNEVAEHTVSLLLSLLRCVPALDRGVRAGRWDGVAMAAPVLPFSETTVGVVGAGRIGREVLRRLKALGFRLVAHDPFLPPEAAEALGVPLMSLEDLLAAVDAVTFHLPLTADSRHLLNGERLALMKSTAVVVNTARGGLIDTDALAEALASGRLRGAALDVFEVEPLPADSPLRSLDNVILTPHMAWYSDKSIQRLQRFAAEEAARALRREPLRCPVV